MKWSRVINTFQRIGVLTFRDESHHFVLQSGQLHSLPAGGSICGINTISNCRAYVTSVAYGDTSTASFMPLDESLHVLPNVVDEKSDAFVANVKSMAGLVADLRKLVEQAGF